jgi:hypothetical protein
MRRRTACAVFEIENQSSVLGDGCRSPTEIEVRTYSWMPTMSDTATQLLASFESLPVKKQHELLVAMLQRTGELPDTLVSDDQLVGFADDLFQTLDAEESNGNETHSG